MGGAERRQHIGQRALRQVFRGAQPHAALQARGAELLFGAGQRFQNQPRVHQQRLAVRGERQRMGIAHEQAPPDVLFEPADMVADRRLRQAELPPRVGEAARAGHGGESLDPYGIEHRGIVIGVSDGSQ